MAESAKAIAEGFLETTGSALRDGDFERFLGCFLLPQVLETFEGPRQIETAEDMRRVFDDVRAHFAKIGVTRLERICLNAEFQDPDTINTTHLSHLLGGDILLQEPYPVLSVVKRVDGRWLIADSTYAISQADHAWALSGKPGSDQ